MLDWVIDGALELQEALLRGERRYENEGHLVSDLSAKVYLGEVTP